MARATCSTCHAVECDSAVFRARFASVGGPYSSRDGTSQDLAASYGLGALGGYVYLRMLHRSVDAVAGEGGGSSSATRLLVPVVLVLSANRCACADVRRAWHVLGSVSAVFRELRGQHTVQQAADPWHLWLRRAYLLLRYIIPSEDTIVHVAGMVGGTS